MISAVPGFQTIRFEVRPFQSHARELVPMVGDASLVDLVTAFEQAAGYEPAGGYAGLVSRLLQVRRPRPVPDRRAAAMARHQGPAAGLPVRRMGMLAADRRRHHHRPGCPVVGLSAAVSAAPGLHAVRSIHLPAAGLPPGSRVRRRFGTHLKQATTMIESARHAAARFLHPQGPADGTGQATPDRQMDGDLATGLLLARR